MKSPTPHLLGSVEIAKRAGISLRQLYHWVEAFQVVQPIKQRHGQRVFQRYSHQDLERIKAVRDLIEWGYTVAAAARLVRENKDGEGLLKKVRNGA